MSKVDVTVEELADEDSPCVDADIVKKRKGTFTEVEFVKKIKIYHKENFNMDIVDECDNKYNCHSLSMMIKATPGKILGCALLEPGTISEIVEKKLGITDVVAYDNTRSTDSWRPICVMPKDQIKSNYVQNENLKELNDYLYCHFFEEEAFWTSKPKPNHVNGCKCHRCNDGESDESE